MNWSDITFGVEVECFIPSGTDIIRKLREAGVDVSTGVGMHTTTTGFKVVGDGSLRWSGVGNFNGVELVSPVLKGEQGIATLRTAISVLESNGAKVNATCGVHVHVGAGGASAKQIKNLAKLYLKYANDFDSLLPTSRRQLNNRFCRNNRAAMFAGMTGEQIDAKFESANTVAAVSRLMNGSHPIAGYVQHRYYAMNFMSMASHGTVEFRQHSGSVDQNKVSNWVRLITGITATAFSVEQVSVAGEGGLQRLLRKADRDGATYYRQRHATFNRGA